MSLVSVVIPNHNYARYVVAAVESVLNQSHSEIEVIVVDNGSTDDSVARLRELGGKIRLIEQENRGQSGARNRGIEECRGKWIAFCDADDYWCPNKVSEQLRKFDRPSVGLVYTGYYLCDEELRPLRKVKAENRGNVLNLFAQGSAAVVPAGESSVIVRRSVLEKVGPFDESLSISAGFDLYRRISQEFEIECVEEPLLMYRQHGSNATRRVDAYAADYLLALDKMFADPAAASLLPMRSHCLGRAHISLSGAYLHYGDYPGSLRHLWKGLMFSPAEMKYVLSIGHRAWRRRREARKS